MCIRCVALTGQRWLLALRGVEYRAVGACQGRKVREAAGAGPINSLVTDEADELGACQAPHAINLLIRLLNERAHHLLHPGEGQGQVG